MAQYHRVQQGEYLASIANKYGFSDCRTIYDHPKNAQLKQKRPNPNVLYPGDVLYIPEKQDKQEARSTGRQYTFEFKSPLVLLRIYVRDDGQPYANTKYCLTVGNEHYEDYTNQEGLVEKEIPIEATEALLTFEEEGLSWVLQIAHLDPITTISGVQARLNNLGFPCGNVDGIIGPKTRTAIQSFQEKHQLSVTGDMDRETRAKLQEEYDRNVPS
jgi:N-acetylmuramoyl-L-alanine amidase